MNLKIISAFKREFREKRLKLYEEKYLRANHEWIFGSELIKIFLLTILTGVFVWIVRFCFIDFMRDTNPTVFGPMIGFIGVFLFGILSTYFGIITLKDLVCVVAQKGIRLRFKKKLSEVTLNTLVCRLKHPSHSEDSLIHFDPLVHKAECKRNLESARDLLLMSEEELAHLLEALCPDERKSLQNCFTDYGSCSMAALLEWSDLKEQEAHDDQAQLNARIHEEKMKIEAHFKKAESLVSLSGKPKVDWEGRDHDERTLNDGIEVAQLQTTTEMSDRMSSLTPIKLKSCFLTEFESASASCMDPWGESQGSKAPSMKRLGKDITRESSFGVLIESQSDNMTDYFEGLPGHSKKGEASLSNNDQPARDQMEEGALISLDKHEEWEGYLKQVDRLKTATLPVSLGNG